MHEHDTDRGGKPGFGNAGELFIRSRFALARRNQPWDTETPCKFKKVIARERA